MIYIDTTGDQASDDDPKGYYTFTSGSEDIGDITLELLNKKESQEFKGKESEKECDATEKKEKKEQ